MKFGDLDYTQAMIAGGLAFAIMPLVGKGEMRKEHWLSMENFYSAIEMGFADGIGQLISEGVGHKYQDMTNVVSAAVLYPVQRRLFNNDHKYTKNIVSSALIDSGAIVLNEPIQNNIPMMKSSKKRYVVQPQRQYGSVIAPAQQKVKAQIAQPVPQVNKTVIVKKK